MPKLKLHHSLPQLTLDVSELDNIWVHNTCNVPRCPRMTCNDCAFTLTYMCTAEARVREEKQEITLYGIIPSEIKGTQINQSEPK